MSMLLSFWCEKYRVGLGDISDDLRVLLELFDMIVDGCDVLAVVLSEGLLNWDEPGVN